MSERSEHLHLDDERLSAGLDGEGTADELVHLEDCQPCSSRRERLSTVTRLVSAPPPLLAPERKEAAIAAALDAMDPAPASRTAVAPLRRPTPHRWHPPAWLLPAAAAVVLFALMVPLLVSSNGGSDDAADQAAGGAVQEESATDDAGEDAETTVLEGPGGSPTDGGDLGPIGPDTDLQVLTEPSLRADGPPEASPSAGNDGDELRPEVVACEERLRGEDPDLGELRYVARATWEGQPALVLGFEVPGARRLDARVHVRTATGCDPLTVVSFAT